MGIAVVIVTHNIEEAVYMGQKILVLVRCRIGPGEIIDNPEAFHAGLP
jgi:ABC-type nitrate/sulfonate/bicarbonate transport system ATPase subunit